MPLALINPFGLREDFEIKKNINFIRNEIGDKKNLFNGVIFGFWNLEP